MSDTFSQNHFAQKLLELKKDTGWSWQRMADEFNKFHGGIQGVTGPTLFRYAKGTSRPRNEMLRRYVLDAINTFEETEQALLLSEANRKAAEEDLAAFFNLSLDLFSIANETHFLKLNPAWTNALGWSLDELKSRPWIDFIHPDDVEPTKAAAAKMNSDHLTIEFENRYRRKDGNYCRLAWKATQWHNGKSYTVCRVKEDER